MKIGIDYCPNPASKEFQELKSIFGEAKAYLLWDRNHGNPLDMAPNGAQSQLFQTYLNLFNGDREKALVAKSKVYLDEFLNWFGDWTGNNEEYLDSEGVIKHVQSDGKIKLSLSTSTKEHPRQIILEPQGDNKYYVHMKIWDGEKIPGEISDEDKHKLFNALYKELPVGAEILFPKSGEGYYGTRGTVAGLMRLSRDERFSKGSEGVLQYEDKDGSIKEYKGTSFIKRGINSVSKVVDENGEPLVVYHGTNIENISIFDRTQIPEEQTLVGTGTATFGNFFSDKQNDAKGFADITKLRRRSGKATVYDTFLNIKNPMYFETLGDFRDYSHKEGHYNENGDFVSDVKLPEEYDGVIVKRRNSRDDAKEFVAPNSNQIKSATDNNGEFSTENDNIYYHIMKSRAEQVQSQLEKEGYVKRNGNYYLLSNKPNAAKYVWETCRNNGVCAYIGDKEKNGHEFTVVRIYQHVQSDEEISEKKEKIINLAEKLAKKFPGITFRFVSKKNVPKNINKNSVSWFDSGVVYLVNENLNEEVTIEEFLHPFVSILQLHNRAYFDELIFEIKRLYPELVKQIDENYTDAEGFNQGVRDNEYVAQGLAKAMRQSRHKNESVKDVLRSFGEWLINLFRCFVTENHYSWENAQGQFEEYSRYVLHPEKLGLIRLKDLARLLNADDIEVDMSNYTPGQIFHHMADPTKTMDQIATDITEQFEYLYKSYAGNPRKTFKQQQTQNTIFEKLSKLRTIQNEEAIKIAINTGLNIIGKRDANGNIDPESVWGVLEEMEKRPVPYDGVSPDDIISMYRNAIGFFKNFIESIPKDLTKIISGQEGEKMQKSFDALQISVGITMEKWQNALVYVIDKTIDDTIDSDVTLADDQLKEDMKTVYKDWAHTNFYYGDIYNATSIMMNFGQINNPIIRLAFNLIQKAESKIQFEAQPIAARITRQYRRAKKEGHRLSPDWQTVFMEFDRNGDPTGNFVRDINYGQYQQDLNAFVDKLNADFEARYGHSYILDESGTLVNTATMTKAIDEEWDDVPNAQEPHYVEYMRKIYEFKCAHADLRYTYDYYKERLSQPYSENNPEGHGLSPIALYEYNRIQSNINYYLDLCTDKKTGLHHPELLDPENKAKLNEWEEQLKQLSNVFDENGDLKRDQKLQIAQEITAWQRWIGEKLQTEVDLDAFFNERQDVINKVNSGEYDPSVLRDFDKYNASFGINQDFLNQTIGQFENMKGEPALVIWARIIKMCINSFSFTSKGQNKFEPDLQQFENRKNLWRILKAADQEIDDGGIKQSKQFNDVFSANFKMSPVLYRDINGYAVDRNGNIVLPQDEDQHDDLLTYFDYMVDKYTTKAEQQGFIDNLIDDNGNNITFSGTRDQIRQQVEDLLTYTHRYFDKQGNLTEDKVPLSIFSIMEPIPDTFNNLKTGRVERTREYIPRGRFATKSDKWHNPVKYYNDLYDRNALIAEQPKRFDNNGDILYDNSEAFDKIKGETKQLYDDLIDVMKQAQIDNGFDSNQFSYKLPQINASDAALMSRVFKTGLQDTVKHLWDSATTVQANDYDMRTFERGLKNPDGSVAATVPHRFLRPLDDPRTITHDVTAAVILFMHASKNYKYKTEVESQVEAIRYGLDSENRSETAIDVPYSRAAFDAMMNAHMYGMEFGNRKRKADTKAYTFGRKAARSAHRFEAVQILGLNLISILVGGGDSIAKMFRDAFTAKYMNPLDLLTGIADVLRELPFILGNFGNPVANNAVVGKMQLFGIGKDFRRVYENERWGRFRKGVTNVLMGGYSMIDYFNNSILLRSFCNNVRFYDGGVIPTGFYTQYEMREAFIKAGKSPRWVWLTHMCCTKTLWGVIKYKHGKTWIDPKYEQYNVKEAMDGVRRKTLQRSALYNGMNPDNDLPRYKQSIGGAILGAMRAWLTQQGQHLIAGTDDTSVREFEIKEETYRKGIFTKKRKNRIKKARTIEQQNKRLGWNFETGTPMDEILLGVFRGINKVIRKIYYWCSFNSKGKSIKLSYVEKYALRDAVITLAGILLLMNLSMRAHIFAQSAVKYKPQNRTETSLGYQMQHFVDHDIWKLLLDDYTFRVTESQLSGVDPFTTWDIVSSVTVLKQGVEDHVQIVGVASDLLGASGHESSETLKTGKYKYYTRTERSLYKFVGPMDNLVTSLTYNGLVSNLHWYTSRYGQLWRGLYGFDFKMNKMKETKSGKGIRKSQKGIKKSGGIQKSSKGIKKSE